MLNIKLYLSILFIFLSVSLWSKNTSIIKGVVVDNTHSPVIYANVALYNIVDSTLVKLELTDENGVFRLINISKGNYWIEISYVGFQNHLTSTIILGDENITDLKTVQMKPISNELAEVVVTTERPLIELKPNKMVFNVQSSITSTGSNAFQLLRKAPGIIIDNNDNISMAGKSGVRFYIDGKKTPLDGDALIAFLKTINGTDIDAIEVITNPSAKYDAEGNGGIINIKLKKNNSLGANANIALAYGQGRRSDYDGSINGNYRNEKINAFANYGYTSGADRESARLNREQFGNYFDQYFIANNDWDGHNFKGGVDFFINKEQTIGVLINGYVDDNKSKIDGRTSIGQNSTYIIDSILVANTFSNGNNNNFNYNINYQYSTDSGISWNMDVDYGLFKTDLYELQPNTYIDPFFENVLTANTTSNDKLTKIDIFTFKMDHERPLFKGVLGIGAKSAYVKTDNDFDFYNIINEAEVLDLDRTNQFVYKEYVHAAYFNYNREFEKIAVQLGLRAERTTSEGNLTSLQVADPVEREYLDWFPALSMTYTINENNSLELSYSRRINRPSYESLNPFVYKLDELSSIKGNPNLNPEYTNSFQLSHSFNYRFFTTLNYSRTKDLITQILDIEGERESFLSTLNIAKQNNLSLTLSMPLPINDWWSTLFNITGFQTQNKADYGGGRTIDTKVTAYNLYSQQTFKFSNDVTFEISGWYASPSVWGGNFETKSMGSLDAGIQKKLFSGNASLKLSVSDIFRTSGWRGNTRFGDLFLEGHGNQDSRRLNIGFNYSFGNIQLKQARQRKTGLEEEKNRI